MSGVVRVITRDGHLVRQFKCPGCGSWGDIDDDQFNGRVSIDHTGDGCSFHETIDLHDAQRRERAARAVAGGEPPAASPASKAFAFAALEAILAGEWDRYLLRLRGAIEQRRKTPEYAAHIVAGGTDD